VTINRTAKRRNIAGEIRDEAGQGCDELQLGRADPCACLAAEFPGPLHATYTTDNQSS